MKVKHIYSKGSSYYWGKNPFNDQHTDIVEYNGKYYEVYYSGNHTSISEGIRKSDFNSSEPLPEEYKRDDGKTEYYLRHKGGEEIDIDLTRYEPEEITDELKEIYIKENSERNTRSYEVEKKNNPSLDYDKIIEEADLTPEEKTIAEAYVKEIQRELIEDKYLSLSTYSDIIKNLPSIAKGNSIVVTHTQGYYSKPEDDLIENSQMLRGKRLADSGEHIEHYWGIRDTKPSVFSLEGRTVQLKDGREYKGSYKKQGYCIDIFTKDGEPYISPNVYINWANSQDWHSKLDLSLPVARFGVESGKEEEFQSYNDEVKAAKESRKQFFEETIADFMQTFGLSREQANEILQYAGTVTALKGATSLGKAEVPDKDLRAMLRKISYDGIGSISEDINKAVGNMNLDSMQASASTLLYLDELLGGEQQRRDKVLETQGIDDELLEKFKELYNIREERENAEQLVNSSKKESRGLGD